jgi:hypothetical protein
MMEKNIEGKATPVSGEEIREARVKLAALMQSGAFGQQLTLPMAVAFIQVGIGLLMHATATDESILSVVEKTMEDWSTLMKSEAN